MSGTIGFPSEFGNPNGLLGILITGNSAVKHHLDTLTEQAASGYISDTYAGLGSAAGTALRLQPELTSQQAWQDSISATTGKLSIAQLSLSQLSTVASNFVAQTNNLNVLNPSETDSIASSARLALQQVAGLLNSTDAGGYVFAGQDSANAPVPGGDNITSGSFFTAIQTAVAGLASNGATATAAATLSIAASNDPATSPFSAALSQPPGALAGLRSAIATGPGQQETVGILASANGQVASTGTSTTGSYVRDLLRGLATLGSLSSSQVYDPGFSTLVSDTAASLRGVVTTLNQDAGALGDQQAQLTATGTTLSQTQAALKIQLAGVQEVDLAKTLSQISATQTQLQASYQLIAASQSLSLTKYLSAGG